MTDHPAAVDWRLLDQRNEERFLAELTKANAILSGHFTLASGKHADTFVNIKGLYPHVLATMLFGRALALRIIRELGERAQLLAGVVSPAVGGVVHSFNTAYWLTQVSQEVDREILALFAEKIKGSDEFEFLRGYAELIPGGMFVEVEDVITSGGSVAKVIREARKNGGDVALICCIWNRGGITEIEGVPVVSLINLELPTWKPDQCKIDGPCSKELPISTKHGRGPEQQKGVA